MGTPGTPPAEQNTLSWMSHSDSVLDFVGRFLSVKQHQKDQAKAELQGAMSLSQAGFPVDPKVFSKLVKKSGLPIATDEETLKAFHSSTIEQKQKGTQSGDQTGDQRPGQASGAPSMQAPDGSPQYAKEVAEAHNKISQTGKPLDPGEEMGLYMNVLAGRARQIAGTRGMTAQQQAENELHIEDLRAKGLSGDNEARGTLMRMGDIKVDTEFEKWTAMTGEQKKGMFDIIAGNESRAELAARSTKISEGLLSSGKVTNLKDAFRAGKILAEGGELPPDLKVKSASFDELAHQTILGQRLIEMGVPADKISQTLKTAGAAGLENALPTGMKPLALQALQLDKDKLKLEELRYQKEVEIAKRMAAAESRKGITDAQKAQLEEFKSYVEIMKATGKLPEDLKKGIIDKATKAAGMEKEEVKDYFNFVTGIFGSGTHTEYKIPKKVTDESKKAIDELTDEPSEEDNTDEETPSEKVDRTVGKKEEDTSPGFAGFVQGLVGGKKRKPGI